MDEDFESELYDSDWADDGQHDDDPSPYNGDYSDGGDDYDARYDDFRYDMDSDLGNEF